MAKQKEYKYSKNYITPNGGSNAVLPESLKAHNVLDDDLMHSVGLYSTSEIEEAKYSKYSRFGRLLNPQGRLNDCREYLFFVKPDLHIVIPNGLTKDSEIYSITGHEATDTYTANNLTLNPQLGGNGYFRDLITMHPNIVRELQMSAPGNSNDPFSHLLSFSVNSYLDLPSSEASTIDNPSTVFGATYDYLKDAENSDENPTFTLEFSDNRYLDTYHFFKGFAEYHITRKTGLVTPPSMNYYYNKRLHNTMGVYKFIVAEDMETVIYYAYFWGVYPTSYPREAFSDPLFNDGLTFSINFKAAFMEDMNPLILTSFNGLMRPLIKDVSNWIPTVNQNVINDGELDSIYHRSHSFDASLTHDTELDQYNSEITDRRLHGLGASYINGTLPSAALITGADAFGIDGNKPKYRIRWYE